MDFFGHQMCHQKWLCSFSSLFTRVGFTREYNKGDEIWKPNPSIPSKISTRTTDRRRDHCMGVGGWGCVGLVVGGVAGGQDWDS